MLERDSAEWRALTTLLDAHRGGSVHGAGSPRWESRDVYAHPSRWMNRSTHDLEAALEDRSRPLVEGSDDEINARWQSEDSGLSLTRHATGQSPPSSVVSAIRAIPTDNWNAVIEAIANADGADHFAAHRRAIVL